MRRVLAIFFLILFTVSSTEAGQLLRIPLLITHLNEHLQKERNASVYDFLVEHYLSDHDNDGDSDKDRQLPFKSINASAWNSTFIRTQEQEVTTYVPGQLNSFLAFDSDALPSNYHPDIFHPPAQV